MSIIVIAGAKITDDVFSITDPKTGEEIVWNITRIQEAADRGILGPPLVLPMDVLPPSRYDLGNLDRSRIAAFKLMPEILAKPALAIAATEPGHIFCFCDGQHRLTARQELGLADFSTFLVAPENERLFRLIEGRI